MWEAQSDHAGLSDTQSDRQPIIMAGPGGLLYYKAGTSADPALSRALVRPAANQVAADASLAFRSGANHATADLTE
jgi:hypothetical protein